MKKKKITALFLTMAMAFTAVPAQGVMAEEMFLDSAETDDAEAADELEEETADELPEEEISENAGAAGEKQENSDFSDGKADEAGRFSGNINEISLNQEISMKSLGYGQTRENYRFKISVPENGRINLIIDKMAQIDEIISYNYQEIWLLNKDEKEICNRKGWLTGPESYESGMLTVNPGEYILEMNPVRPNLINNEATVKILYQRASEYVGETEDNDSYETATILQNNIEYEGNYSKNSDKDFYRFTMEKPGKAELSLTYKKEEQEFPSYELIREDENGNTE